MPIINESWKSLWNAQEMRILMLASLCFQFGLVFLSTLRKRTGKKLLIFLLWIFYLLADSVAILALGNLLKRQKEGASGSHGGVGLGAFWAPFLLLHLGGPDTITSFSIEDNELWSRHFLALVVQVVAAITVLLELVVVPQLRVPAFFVFIAGLMKYSERILALRSSSMDKLRSSMLKPKSITNAGNSECITQSSSIMDQLRSSMLESKSITNAGIRKYITQSNELLLSNIVDGYDLFKRTMPLVADLRLTSNELHNCRAYFRNCSVWQAFKLVEIELSFLYDVLHTKAVLINGPRGWFWRFVYLELIYSAFALFLMNDEKTGYTKADIITTYVLFGSALFIELISLLQIIFSEWMIVALQQKKHLKKLAIFIAIVMSFFFSEGKPQWSNSMGQYSLLSFSLRDNNTIIRRILGAVKVKNLWDKFIFIYSDPVSGELKHLLVEQLRDRLSVDLQELKDGKGERVLQQEACDHLGWSIKDKEFEVSILLWHVATDLCFHAHGGMKENAETGGMKENPETGGMNENPETGGMNENPETGGMNENPETGLRKLMISNRETSLKISNYMVYLLIMQPSMMPDGIGKVRFQDTCTAVEVFYKQRSELKVEGARNALSNKERSRLKVEEARKALLNLREANDESVEKKTWSVLSDARRLANELNKLEENKRWRLISRVWVEMLSHAAINCKTYYHAMQLSKGGELLTHVYLLMVHTCTGDTEDAARGNNYQMFIKKVLLRA